MKANLMTVFRLISRIREQTGIPTGPSVMDLSRQSGDVAVEDGQFAFDPEPLSLAVACGKAQEGELDLISDQGVTPERNIGHSWDAPGIDRALMSGQDVPRIAATGLRQGGNSSRHIGRDEEVICAVPSGFYF
jgi:hypothetical protein